MSVDVSNEMPDETTSESVSEQRDEVAASPSAIEHRQFYVDTVHPERPVRGWARDSSYSTGTNLDGGTMDCKKQPAFITGSLDQELLLRNEYLVTENRILRRPAIEPPPRWGHLEILE